MLNVKFIGEKEILDWHRKSDSFWFYRLPLGLEGREICKEREVNDRPLWKSSEAKTQQKKINHIIIRFKCSRIKQKEQRCSHKGAQESPMQDWERSNLDRRHQNKVLSLTGHWWKTPPLNHVVEVLLCENGQQCFTNTLPPAAIKQWRTSQMLLTFNTLLIYIYLHKHQCNIHPNHLWHCRA